MKYIIALFILFVSFNLYSQSIIIAEDVVMKEVELIDPVPYYILYQTKESKQIELLKQEVEELKSQVKELSILLKELLEKQLVPSSTN